MTGCERNLKRPELDRLPIVEFVHDVKSEIVHQISHARWNHDRLVRSYAPQRAPVEMIKMRMRHQHEVNRREMMDLEAGLFQSFNDLEPFGPDRLDHNVDFMSLDEK